MSTTPAKAPFNVYDVTGNLKDQFSTAYEAYVYLRDALKMEGLILDEAGKDITDKVVPEQRLDKAKAPEAPSGDEKKEG